MRLSLTLNGESLKALETWEFATRASDAGAQAEVLIAPEARARVQKSAAFVDSVVRGTKAVYGINTGFGKFAEVAIPNDKLDELQRNLILSHACGTGPELSRAQVFCMWILRLNTLCRGNSGVRPQTIDFIIKLLQAGCLAEVPSRGSVGASGDLAPSAHATLALIGEGRVTLPIDGRIERMEAREALKKLGLAPLKLAPKEGLCLINGTQLTATLGLEALSIARQSLGHANLAVAMTIEGLRGSHAIVDEQVLRSRNHPGAVECGDAIRAWLGGDTEISKSHENCGQVQDPYSLRCAPQVHGCVADELEQAERVLTREINSSTDNPLIFADSGASRSGGNFHAIYPARVNDSLAATLTVLGSISERRTALAMSPKSSRLPAFLIQDGGLNSGFMMLHVTAAALVSEAKALSHPASVDSIPTSDDREDHVSMGPAAGFKAVQAARNVRTVIAIELIVGAQALDLLAPLKSSAGIRKAHARIRAEVPFLDRDRILADDLRRVDSLIEKGELLKP